MYIKTQKKEYWRYFLYIEMLKKYTKCFDENLQIQTGLCKDRVLRDSPPNKKKKKLSSYTYSHVSFPSFEKYRLYFEESC